MYSCTSTHVYDETCQTHSHVRTAMKGRCAPAIVLEYVQVYVILSSCFSPYARV